MVSQGANSPVTVVSDNSFGDNAWTTPGDAVSSNDVYAVNTITMVVNTEYLKATDFGFTIPANATIDGITVSVERKATQVSSGIQDVRVRIVKGGVIGTTDKSITDTWETTDTTKTYGSSSDLWGETWTGDDINATNFGFVIAGAVILSNGGVASSELNPCEPVPASIAVSKVAAICVGV